jgi:hypothetical protein
VAESDCRYTFQVTSNDATNLDDFYSFEMLSWATADAPVEGTLVELDSYISGEFMNLEASESITVRMVETAEAGFTWGEPTYMPDDDSCIMLQDNNLGDFTTLYK